MGMSALSNIEMPLNVTYILSAISWADIGYFMRRLNMSSSAAVWKILDSINFLLKLRMVSGFMGMLYLLANYYNDKFIIYQNGRGSFRFRKKANKNSRITLVSG